jgi:hypothetical protein
VGRRNAIRQGHAGIRSGDAGSADRWRALPCARGGHTSDPPHLRCRRWTQCLDLHGDRLAAPRPDLGALVAYGMDRAAGSAGLGQGGLAGARTYRTASPRCASPGTVGACRIPSQRDWRRDLQGCARCRACQGLAADLLAGAVLSGRARPPLELGDPTVWCEWQGLGGGGIGDSGGDEVPRAGALRPQRAGRFQPG